MMRRVALRGKAGEVGHDLAGHTPGPDVTCVGLIDNDFQVLREPRLTGPTSVRLPPRQPFGIAVEAPACPEVAGQSDLSERAEPRAVRVVARGPARCVGVGPQFGDLRTDPG